ncbi:hypothetical protein [Marinoscillum sp. 108]|uniref:DUF3098 domain-containing protein n=1 Tax=Marinoscillum luteum TaxID=861051 RepID=A0ABW7NAA5_9BACT|nr:hypothetical protein [Marinoscillum sp. 108]VXD18109.1 conserved hypothetical protein [Marinoscillum sp. 108]
MKKPYRYALYFGIGVLIYFAMDGENNPESLEEVHKMAPALIIGVVVLLFLVRYIISKKEKD